MFEEKIKKPIENYLHDGSNFITINSLNTIIANAMEKSKLGEAGFDDYDIFLVPQALRRKNALMIVNSSL